MANFTITGQVETPISLTFAELSEMPAEVQIADVQSLGAKRSGCAVKLSAILDRCRPLPEADHLGLHATADDFHASLPLDAVRDRAVLIYGQDGQPLPLAAGGPFRLFIPDHSQCKASEIDECANVKFIDRIELTIGKGHDNRPRDEDEHRAIHEH
ncbi:MAG: molybdopterin-dependent oxidoreductase [Planctomycetales bacterium]|nr:molybdopterin-dependent oxidoreductase [Planctomycetales bacterium]